MLLGAIVRDSVVVRLACRATREGVVGPDSAGVVGVPIEQHCIEGPDTC